MKNCHCWGTATFSSLVEASVQYKFLLVWSIAVGVDVGVGVGEKPTRTRIPKSMELFRFSAASKTNKTKYRPTWGSSD